MDIKKELWPGWETVRLIGQGSFGAVYEIQREIRGRTEHAALKVISIPQNESEIRELRTEEYDDESITQYFADSLGKIEEEYAMMADLKGHSNVVYCDDIRTVQHDNGFGWDIYIKMELLTPLKSYPRDKITDAQVIKLGMDIGDALKLCEDLNIVHRDIKPENIFVSRNGNYKLGDFGIAKTMEGTTGGTKTGTYDYMSPEVYNNLPYHTQTDIYSLGLVMYWLLNNWTPPFLPTKGKKPTPSEKSIARDRRFSGEQIPAPKNGSNELKRIVLKACAFDPKDRYQSAREMREDLLHLSGGHVSEQPAEFITDWEICPKPDYGETVGPNYGHSSGNDAVEEEETVGPIFKSNLAKDMDDLGKTVGPDFSTKQKQEKIKKKPWSLIATVVLLIILIVGCIYDTCISGGTRKDSEAQAKKDDKTIATPVSSSPETNPDAYESVTSTFYHTVGFHADGSYSTIKAYGTWNEDEYKMLNQYDDITYIDETYTHLGALRKDGTAVAFGENKIGECDVWSWRDLVALDLGACTDCQDANGDGIIQDDEMWDFGWTVGLKSDGRVVATGDNRHGQCNVDTWENVKQIDIGAGFTVGLKNDGTVLLAGNNFNDKLNVSSWKNIEKIYVNGHNFVVGLKSDGTVVATGINNEGQCNVGTWTDIVDLSVGIMFTVGLKKDGTVVAVGSNGWERCDNLHWEDIVDIEAGPQHIVGLKLDGTVVAWGYNAEGQCNVSTWKDVQQISAGRQHTAALTCDGQTIYFS